MLFQRTRRGFDSKRLRIPDNPRNVWSTCTLKLGPMFKKQKQLDGLSGRVGKSTFLQSSRQPGSERSPAPARIELPAGLGVAVGVPAETGGGPQGPPGPVSRVKAKISPCFQQWLEDSPLQIA